MGNMVNSIVHEITMDQHVPFSNIVLCVLCILFTFPVVTWPLVSCIISSLQSDRQEANCSTIQGRRQQPRVYAQHRRVSGDDHCPFIVWGCLATLRDIRLVSARGWCPRVGRVGKTKMG